MAQKSKRKVINYRRVVFSDNTLSLQTLLESLIDGDYANVESRRETFTQDSDVFRIINKNDKFYEKLFGQFVSFEPGKKAPLLMISSDGPFYPLNTKSPGQNQAYADELFYFGIRGNDLVYIQTSSIRLKEFETYLNWLLKEKSKTVKPEVVIQIQSQPGQAVYDKVSKSEVKSIKIGSDIISVPAQTENLLQVAEDKDVEVTKHSVEQKKIGKQVHQFGGKAWEFLKTYLDQTTLDQIRFEEDFDEANLHLSVQLKFIRKTSTSGQKALDKIASVFRHVEDVDYELELKGGGKITNEEINVKKNLSINLTSQGLVDEHDLYIKMNDFLIETLSEQG